MAHHHCFSLDLATLELRQFVSVDSLVDEGSQYLKILLFFQTFLELFGGRIDEVSVHQDRAVSAEFIFQAEVPPAVDKLDRHDEVYGLSTLVKIDLLLLKPGFEVARIMAEGFGLLLSELDQRAALVFLSFLVHSDDLILTKS